MFIAGILIFFGIHLVPLISTIKESLKSALGENTYMIFFSLISLIGFLLIVLGYEASSNSLYAINAQAFLYSKYIMFFSLTFLIAANVPSFIKKFSKHPMSIGIAIWSAVHLLTNSDTVSVILFSTFMVYSIISVIVSESRKVQVKEIKPRLLFDIFSIVLGAMFTALAFNFHEYLSGVSLT